MLDIKIFNKIFGVDTYLYFDLSEFKLPSQVEECLILTI